METKEAPKTDLDLDTSEKQPMIHLTCLPERFTDDGQPIALCGKVCKGYTGGPNGVCDCVVCGAMLDSLILNLNFS